MANGRGTSEPRTGAAPHRSEDFWGGYRPVVLAALAVLGLAVSVALIWPITDLIAAHDVGLIKGSARAAALSAAREAVRTQLLTLGAGLFAAGALVYTARNFTLSRQTFKLTERGQVTDRYTKAIEQLGSDKLDVRVGGIYALERIARESDADHPAVMEVLAAFIREQSRERWPPPGRQPGVPSGQVPQSGTRPDVQVAVTVIGRRLRRDPEVIDLSGADLTGAYLSCTNFTRALFNGARLSGANLIGANFAEANLSRADLSGAYLGEPGLSGADLSGAYLIEADLTGADLISAVLAKADLTGAYLADANFSSADLSGADFVGADLRDAVLVGADLTEAQFTGVYFLGVPPGLPPTEVETDLTGALWADDAPVPAGWERAPGSSSFGRLRRAGSA
jgi:hypothetical protein